MNLQDTDLPLILSLASGCSSLLSSSTRQNSRLSAFGDLSWLSSVQECI